MYASIPRPGGGNVTDNGDGIATAGRLSDAGRERLLAVPGNPLFLCAWERAVFIHYEVEAVMLQREVPFELDLHEGRAYVSLVAFTMRDMRPRIGGRMSAALLKPIASHGFLNVRTYVKHEGEAGIYFLAEWLPNRLSLMLGPRVFGLPYRHGRLEYQHEHESGQLWGRVIGEGNALEYSARLYGGGGFVPCVAGSRDEFLLERYTAFTARDASRRRFRVWHPPWPQADADIQIQDNSLLCATWPLFREARLSGANYSPGFKSVWMGRPQRVGRWSGP